MAFGSVKTLGVRTSLVEAVPALPGTRLSLRPPGCSVDASSILFARVEPPTPPWTPDAIRVGGSPLPDRDLHPARDAKLSWRDNAQAEARATRYRLTPATKRTLWPVASSAMFGGVCA
jgi:hypothetical protein